MLFSKEDFYLITYILLFFFFVGVSGAVLNIILLSFVPFVCCEFLVFSKVWIPDCYCVLFGAFLSFSAGSSYGAVWERFGVMLLHVTSCYSWHIWRFRLALFFPSASCDFRCSMRARRETLKAQCAKFGCSEFVRF